VADHCDLIAAGADFDVGVEQGPEIGIAAEIEVLEADPSARRGKLRRSWLALDLGLLRLQADHPVHVDH
jgi:hypothetical protein